MADYKIDFASISWETPMQGIRCKVHKQGGRQLRLVEYAKNMVPHWCEKGHVGYMLEGRFEIAFEKEAIIYNPGDGIFIPSGKEHRHMGKVLTDVVRVVMVEDI